jgi:hydroxymethylbilane synthase
VSEPIRLGTRASVLATTQSRWVGDRLSAALGREVVLVEITTQGDRDAQPLAQLGRPRGVFVSALREALLDHRIDVAVHSLKDLPTRAAAGITLAAVPLREDPRDVVVARDGLTLGELPAGSRIGTGAPRRAAQLHALGLGLEIADIRGNVDTRIRKVREGAYDAVVLARAGLARIGRLDEATEVLDPLQMLPAPGQGALAVETREGDEPDARRGRSRRRPIPGRRHRRACRAGHARGRLRRADRGPRRGRRRATTEKSSGCERPRSHPTGRWRCGCPPPATRPTPRRRDRLARQMLDEGAGQLTETPLEQPVTDCERQEA